MEGVRVTCGDTTLAGGFREVGAGKATRVCSVDGSWGALTQGSVLSISCETGWIPGMSGGVRQEEA